MSVPTPGGRSETPEQLIAAARDALAHPEMLVSPGRWREFVAAMVGWIDERKVADTYGEGPDA